MPTTADYSAGYRINKVTSGDRAKKSFKEHTMNRANEMPLEMKATGKLSPRKRKTDSMYSSTNASIGDKN